MFTEDLSVPNETTTASTLHSWEGFAHTMMFYDNSLIVLFRNTHKTFDFYVSQ